MTDSPITEQELDEWEKVALAATPGPWRVDGDMLVTDDPDERADDLGSIADLRYFHMPRDRDNAEFIATFDPPTILSLPSALREAGEALEPSNDWLLEQARGLSSAKDEDSVRALAWNINIAFKNRASLVHAKLKGEGREG